MNRNILCSENIRLRALEPCDAGLLYEWENDTELWEHGSTVAPFSRDTLEKYIQNSDADIYAAKQLRLMIVSNATDETIGTIDLYDFDARNRRAGIGIFVTEKHRERHCATEALAVLLNYCATMLLLHQVYVEIQEKNSISIQLFAQAGFSKVGTKRDWLLTANGFENVVVMQKILPFEK